MRSSLRLLSNVAGRAALKKPGAENPLNKLSPELRRRVTGLKSEVGIVGKEYHALVRRAWRGVRMQWEDLPRVQRFARAEGSPEPSELLAELDRLGVLWDAENVGELLEAVIQWSLTKREEVNHPYLAGRGRDVLMEVERWQPVASTRGPAAYNALTLWAMLGDIQQLESRVAVLEHDGGPLTEGAYRAMIRGFGHARNDGKVEEVRRIMAKNGISESPALRTFLADYYASSGQLDKLAGSGSSETTTETPDEPGGVDASLSEHALGMAAVTALDNFDVDRALQYVEQAVDRGVTLHHSDHRGSPAYRRVTWKVFFAVETRVQARQAVRILGKMLRAAEESGAYFPRITAADAVSPFARYVACYDAFAYKAAEVGAFEEAAEAFSIVDTYPSKAVYHIDSCHAMLSLACAAFDPPAAPPPDAAGRASIERWAAAVVVHMSRNFLPASFSTLLHLQTLLDCTWSAELTAEIARYCPNFEDRLLYYVPGFRSFRISRKSVGGAAGLQALARPYSTIVVPDASYLMTRASKLVQESALNAERSCVFLPFSELSSLQVAGDAMREQIKESGGMMTPPDVALRILGSYLTSAPRENPHAGHGMLVIGAIEQRVCAYSMLGEPDELAPYFHPSNDEGRLAAFALALACTGTKVDLRCASREAHELLLAAINSWKHQEHRHNVTVSLYPDDDPTPASEDGLNSSGGKDAEASAETK
ncbi:hypothetical protein DIPPA_29337 [Diplonema papillatum]|nr:hypothetical protein DIPPA_29337 [Diplonema papillatum]